MKETKIKPFGMIDKVGYAMGDMGCNFSFQLISTYMQLYYMQYIGVSAEHYAAIILISKLWDAINDILIGNMVDTKRIGKGSKYMPWIIFGGATLIIFNVMIFAPVKNFQYWGKFLWCLLSYCLWSVSYTMVNVPYGSLHSVITSDPNERTSLSTWRSIGAALPNIIIMVVLPLVAYKKEVNANNEEVSIFMGERLLPVAIIFSIVAFVVLWGMTKLVKERVVRQDSGENVTGGKAFFSAFKSFFTNRAMVGATVATIALVAFFNSTMSLNNMVFQYFFNEPEKTSLAMIGSYAPLVVMMIFIGKLTQKYGKKTVCVVSTLVGAVAGLIFLFVPMQPNATGMIIYIIALMLMNTGGCIFQITVWAIIADCIEASYIKTQKSEEGSLYALYSFFRKLSQGIGQAVVALGLSAIGFIEGDGVTQLEGFGERVKTLYIALLFAGSLIAFVALKFIYNIGKKEEDAYKQLAAERIETE